MWDLMCRCEVHFFVTSGKITFKSEKMGQGKMYWNKINFY